jgi:hypothetical protein
MTLNIDGTHDQWKSHVPPRWEQRIPVSEPSICPTLRVLLPISRPLAAADSDGMIRGLGAR